MFADLSELELDLAQAAAMRRGIPVSQLLAERRRAQQQLDSTPQLEYRNGVLFVDGQRATDEQVAGADAQNPHRPQSWLANPEDRQPTPNQQASELARQQFARDLRQQRQDEMLAQQKDIFDRPLSPIIRSDSMPPRGVSIEKTTVSAIPAAKSSGNPSAGAGAGLRGTLSKVAGNVTTRTGKARS